MGGEQGGVVADDGVDRQVVVAGEVEEKAGDRAATTVGLLVP